MRAHLLEGTGDLPAAARSYADAAARTDNARERDYLIEQAARTSENTAGQLEGCAARCVRTTTVRPSDKTLDQVVPKPPSQV